ncbi:hypothetical protein B0A49_05925 [Cryomyces minteri]|uniref:Chromo shadow domain-containing protein n=1 Tax=Cryomyces minteri TaxID=331657 RepID=A0A4V5NEF4_9PEZI|nr:hypothetical protein B0A49_05925 [Cryomyces minteri]
MGPPTPPRRSFSSAESGNLTPPSTIDWKDASAATKFTEEIAPLRAAMEPKLREYLGRANNEQAVGVTKLAGQCSDKNRLASESEDDWDCHSIRDDYVYSPARTILSEYGRASELDEPDAFTKDRDGGENHPAFTHHHETGGWNGPSRNGNWEEEIKTIDSVNELVSPASGEKEIVLYITWRDGRQTCHPLSAVKDKAPQKVLQFYERNFALHSLKSPLKAATATVPMSKFPTASTETIADDEQSQGSWSQSPLDREMLAKTFHDRGSAASAIDKLNERFGRSRSERVEQLFSDSSTWSRKLADKQPRASEECLGHGHRLSGVETSGMPYAVGRKDFLPAVDKVRSFPRGPSLPFATVGLSDAEAELAIANKYIRLLESHLGELIGTERFISAKGQEKSAPAGSDTKGLPIAQCRAQLEDIANDIQCIRKAGTTTHVVHSELAAVKEQLANLTARLNTKDVSAPSLGVDAMASAKSGMGADQDQDLHGDKNFDCKDLIMRVDSLGKRLKAKIGALKGRVDHLVCQVDIQPGHIPHDSSLGSRLNDVEQNSIAASHRLNQLESAVGYDSSMNLAEVPSDRACIQQALTDLTASISELKEELGQVKQRGIEIPINLGRIERRLDEVHDVRRATKDSSAERQQTESARVEAVKEGNYALKFRLEKLEQLVDATRKEKIKFSDHSGRFNDLEARFQGHVQSLLDASIRLDGLDKLVGCGERGPSAGSLAPGQSQQKSLISLEAHVAELDKLQKVTSPSMRLPVRLPNNAGGRTSGYGGGCSGGRGLKNNVPQQQTTSTTTPEPSTPRVAPPVIRVSANTTEAGTQPNPADDPNQSRSYSWGGGEW